MINVNPDEINISALSDEKLDQKIITVSNKLMQAHLLKMSEPAKQQLTRYLDALNLERQERALKAIDEHFEKNVKKTNVIETDPSMSNVPFIPMKKKED